MRPQFLCLALGALLAAAAWPETGPGTGDASSYLGLGLQETLERFGVPVQVYPVRGAEAWQDDVVFRYEDGVHLFWFQDRVWQVRLDKTFAGDFRGLRMGAARERVRELLGAPMREEGEWVLYQFAGGGFPVRVRIFFDKVGIEDLYIYRGDF